MIRDVPVSRILRGNNDRKEFPIPPLLELAASVVWYGLRQKPNLRPVLLLDNGDRVAPMRPAERLAWTLLDEGQTLPPNICLTYKDGQSVPRERLSDIQAMFEIMSGERRCRAVTTILSWEAVPAEVDFADDETASAVMLSENTSRVDLNPIEEAEAFQKRIDEGLTVEQVAAQAGKRVAHIKSRLNLISLPYEVKHLVKYGNLTLGHAEALVGLDLNRQRLAVRYLNGHPGLTIAKFKEYVQQLRAEQIQETAATFSMFDLRAYEVEPPKPAVFSGKQAVTGAPVSGTLPPVCVSTSDSAAHIVDRYIADLLAGGHQAAAEAIGHVYNALVANNYMTVPADGRLSRQGAPAGQIAVTHKL